MYICKGMNIGGESSCSLFVPADAVICDSYREMCYRCLKPCLVCPLCPLFMLLEARQCEANL